jgi:hypothetical protein
MAQRPSQHERATEIMSGEIEFSPDAGGLSKRLDKLRHTVERRREAMRHPRTTKAGEIRRDAAEPFGKASRHPLPHNTAVGIPVNQ